MKKLFLPFLFFVGICSANTSTNYLFTDCHAQACEEVAAWEEHYELTEGEAEQIYLSAYAECEN